MGELTVNERILGFMRAHKPGEKSMLFAKGDTCATLVQAALRYAKARDFNAYPRQGDNYVWGQGIELDELQPGDILQFDGHEFTLDRIGADDRPYPRHHHSALVQEVIKQGEIVRVLEQHIRPDIHKIQSNIVYLKSGNAADSFGTPYSYTVNGQVYGYRPQPNKI